MSNLRNSINMNNIYIKKKCNTTEELLKLYYGLIGRGRYKKFVKLSQHKLKKINLRLSQMD